MKALLLVTGAICIVVAGGALSSPWMFLLIVGQGLWASGIHYR